MIILAIETSCDETAIALVEVSNKNKKTTFKVLANEVSSQIDVHKEFGGVFPALAKREHIKNLPLVLEKIIKKSGVKIEKEVDAIAVTTGPGLEPALWTGIVFAKELSQKYNIPIVSVNHMEGHIFSVFPKNGNTFTVDNKKEFFPILSLLVSGGHTEIILIKDWSSDVGKMKYKKLGQTRDDAAGEAFDKVARMLLLPYPGGPEISKMAEIERDRISSSPAKGRIEEGSNPLALQTLPLGRGRKIQIALPRPMMYTKDYDFSFSGLKTAVLYLIRDLKEKNPKILDDIQTKQKIACEFENAVIETLVHKTVRAVKEYKIKTLIVGGGVSANKYLQKTINKEVKKLNFSSPTTKKIQVHFPSRKLTGDNALMIAVSGYFQFKNKKIVKNMSKLKANGNLSL